MEIRTLGEDATQKLEKLKAQMRERVEHPFSGGEVPVRIHQGAIRGLAKNAAQLQVQFALANLSLARCRLAAAG
jgi:IS5 family transposase